MKRPTSNVGGKRAVPRRDAPAKPESDRGGDARLAAVAPSRPRIPLPTLILVGADKGGVGKTTVSRALIEYLEHNQVPVRAFDTEAPHGTLVRFFPSITEVVDLTHTSDQMKVIDTLGSSAKVTLVDVRAGELGVLLRALRNIGFMTAARSGEFRLLLFHILGSSVASLGEVDEVQEQTNDIFYYLVKNFTGDGTFFDWDETSRVHYLEQLNHATEIVVPRLDELSFESVDLASVPFEVFSADRARSFVLRGYARKWLDDVWEEFDRAGVMKAVTDA